MHAQCALDHGLVVMILCLGLGVGLVIGNLTKL